MAGMGRIMSMIQPYMGMIEPYMGSIAPYMGSMGMSGFGGAEDF